MERTLAPLATLLRPPPLRFFPFKTFLSAPRFTCRRFPKKAFFLRVASHHLEHWRGRIRRRCILLRRQNVKHLRQGVRTASRSIQKWKFNHITVRILRSKNEPHTLLLGQKIYFWNYVWGIMERSPKPKNSNLQLAICVNLQTAIPKIPQVLLFLINRKILRSFCYNQFWSGCFVYMISCFKNHPY